MFKGNKKRLSRFQATLDADTENELLDHIKLLKTREFGFTPTDVRNLAFQLAQKRRRA